MVVNADDLMNKLEAAEQKTLAAAENEIDRVIEAEFKGSNFIRINVGNIDGWASMRYETKQELINKYRKAKWTINHVNLLQGEIELRYVKK